MPNETHRTLIVTLQLGESSPGVIIEVQHTYATPEDLFETLRAFVRRWAKTPEGRQARQESCNDFNWGDFAEWGTVLREQIPGVLDIAYVYPPASGNLSAAVVDHDELLMPLTSPQRQPKTAKKK